MLSIPPGFAHGFVVVRKMLRFYKASEYYHAASERTLAWNDSDLKIDWQLRAPPIVPERDKRGVPFRSAEVFD